MKILKSNHSINQLNVCRLVPYYQNNDRTNCCIRTSTPPGMLLRRLCIGRVMGGMAAKASAAIFEANTLDGESRNSVN